MNLGENIKKSFLYPLCDYNKFAMLGVLTVFSFLSSICSSFGADNPWVVIVATLIGGIISMYLTGYSVSVIKCGINVKEEIPDFKVGRDILNFFKYLVIGLVYTIIPLIIIFITVFGTGILEIWTNYSSLYSVWKCRYSASIAFQFHVCCFHYIFSNCYCFGYSNNFY